MSSTSPFVVATAPYDPLVPLHNNSEEDVEAEGEDNLLIDPSLTEGHHVVYDREIPLEIRILQQQPSSSNQSAPPPPVDVGTLEAIRCKIMILGEHEGSFKHCRVELTSEKDIFFHYTHSLDEMQFRDIQEEQKLMIEFNEYVNVFIKMCNSTIAEPHAFLGVLVMSKDATTARLDFVQNMEYKFIELLSAEFIASPDAIIRQHIVYRYNAMKAKLAASQARLQDFHAIVKLKNPSLLLQIQQKGMIMPNNTTSSSTSITSTLSRDRDSSPNGNRSIRGSSSCRRRSNNNNSTMMMMTR